MCLMLRKLLSQLPWPHSLSHWEGILVCLRVSWRWSFMAGVDNWSYIDRMVAYRSVAESAGRQSSVELIAIMAS